MTADALLGELRRGAVVLGGEETTLRRRRPCPAPSAGEPLAPGRRRLDCCTCHPQPTSPMTGTDDTVEG
jgi:hypothetical protein